MGGTGEGRKGGGEAWDERRMGREMVELSLAREEEVEPGQEREQGEVQLRVRTNR